MLEWKNIEFAPHDGTLVLVKGKSGYITHKTIIATAYFDPEYRPYWLDACGDGLEFQPIFYAELSENDLSLDFPFYE